MNLPKRLYIFTGKGGVGKTTVSKGFARLLQAKYPGYQVAYLTFQSQSLSSDHKGTQNKEIMGLREISLDLEDCAQNYIESKLSSKMIASWIVKTPFFRALINMVPGFNYVIYLGQILKMQQDNPKLIFVLDAPASGHVLTMIEATSNFKQIFKSGVVFEDTTKMLSLLNDTHYSKIHIVSLPSSMSWQEALELKSGLQSRTPVDVDISMNNSLFELLKNTLNTSQDELPEVIVKKSLFEKDLISSHRSQIKTLIPHSLKNDSWEIEKDMTPYLNELI